MGKHKKTRKQSVLSEELKKECSDSVEAYFARIGPLGADLMPKKEKNNEIQKETNSN